MFQKFLYLALYDAIRSVNQGKFNTIVALPKRSLTYVHEHGASFEFGGANGKSRTF